MQGLRWRHIPVLIPLLTIAAIAVGCSEKSPFRVDGLVPDSLFLVDTLEVTQTDWASKGQSTSGKWQSDRMVACNWHSFLSRSFLRFQLPDTTREMEEANIFLYATRIDGSIEQVTFGLYTLMDSLEVGDIYWDQIPPEDELVNSFTLSAVKEESVLVEVTDLVASWMSGESDQFDIMIKLEEEDTPTEAIAEFGTLQSLFREVESEEDTISVDTRPSLRITYTDTTLWFLPVFDTFSDTLRAPLGMDTLLVSGNGTPSRAFLKFDLSEIPKGANATRAELEFTVAADSSSFDEITIQCHAVVDPGWEGFDTEFGIRGAGTQTLTDHEFQTDEVVDMDITVLVQPLVAELEPNHGFLIKSTKEWRDVDFVKMYPDARLILYYTVPPEVWFRRD